jgi:hypothetical protein
VTGVLAPGFRAALCAVLAAAPVAGCGGGERGQPDVRPSNPGAVSVIPTFSPGTPSPSRSPRIPGGLPDLREIDQKDATAVSKAILTTMYSADSTVDAGLRDAKLRATSHLTPEYAAKIKAEPRQYIPEEWRQRRVYLAVRLTPLPLERGAPSDGPTAAYRQWAMTTTPIGRDGWRGDPKKSVIYVALNRSSERALWRISDVLVHNEG